MPQVLKQLLGSEKFLYVVLLWCLPMLVFTCLGKVTITQWREDSLWALGMLLAGKTLQGTAAAIANGKKPTGDDPGNVVKIKPKKES